MGFVVEDRKSHQGSPESRRTPPEGADLRSRGRQGLVGQSLEDQEAMTAPGRSNETVAGLQARLQHFEDQRRDLKQQIQQAKLLLSTLQDPAEKAEQLDRIDALERQLDDVLARIESTKAKLDALDTRSSRG